MKNPTPEQLVMANALLTGCVKGMKEAFELKGEMPKTVKHLENVLKQAEEALKDE